MKSKMKSTIRSIIFAIASAVCLPTVTSQATPSVGPSTFDGFPGSGHRPDVSHRQPSSVAEALLGITCGFLAVCFAGSVIYTFWKRYKKRKATSPILKHQRLFLVKTNQHPAEPVPKPVPERVLKPVPERVLQPVPERVLQPVPEWVLHPVPEPEPVPEPLYDTISTDSLYITPIEPHITNRPLPTPNQRGDVTPKNITEPGSSEPINEELCEQQNSEEQKDSLYITVQ